jgi:N-acetylglucosaminyldiphosphoundecaprenol N-acetyl-beta-D-mannosaminyltransferase
MVIATGLAYSEVQVAGIPIHATTLASVVEVISALVERKQGGYICLMDAHSFLMGVNEAEHRRALKGASIVLSDGAPVTWLARLQGAVGAERVTGTDLLAAVAQCSQHASLRHVFYGGSENTLIKLRGTFSSKYPHFNIVGHISPPFRVLTALEKQEHIRELKACKADIIWLGLGCPKQEKWMQEFEESLKPAILIGIGAAFDFISGTKRRAPLWQQRLGLEWLYRLLSEPWRLGIRYGKVVPMMLYLCIAEWSSRVLKNL